MEGFSTLALVLLGIGVVLFFTWAGFRQFVRINANKTIKKGTSPIDRNKDRLSQLKAALPGQRTNVANCMATVDEVTSDLTDAEKELGTIESEYKTAKQMGASEAALDALGSRFEKGEEKIKRLKARLGEAQSASNEAQAALDSTVEALKEFADKIEDQELNANLASAIRTAAQAKQQASDINDKLSAASEDFDSTERDLNVARNEAKLAEGSAADRELAEIKKKAAAQSGRSRLDALAGGDANAAK